MQPRPRFLGAVETSSPAAIVIGAPLDATESCRSGTGEGPPRIRIASEVLETYSPRLQRDLSQLPLADWGDIACDGLTVEQALDAIAEATSWAVRAGLLLMLGGEHTATLGALRAVKRRYPELVVLQVDAHADLRDSYEGSLLSHATVMRRVADEVGFERIAQFGIRSGSAEEFVLSRQCLHSTSELNVPQRVREDIGARPLYLTIDIDVLDPSAAPGTGCPEPGGPSFSQLESFLYSLSGMHVVAVDVMEVLPGADVNDITSVAAAKLLREAALLFARDRRP